MAQSVQQFLTAAGKGLGQQFSSHLQHLGSIVLIIIPQYIFSISN